ncbi:hypothetical protein ABID30_000187 [Enterococcus rotai]
MNNAGHKEVPVDDHTVSLCHIGKYDKDEGAKSHDYY